jgi:hypothetical protein
MSNRCHPDSGLIEQLLRDHIRSSVKQALSSVADSIIDEAVNDACKSFEERLSAFKDLEMDRILVKYSVERVRKEIA